MTLAIGSKDVPIGSYTRTILDKLPRAQSKAILGNVRTEEPDVGGITGKLTQGAVDAGFLYMSDVRATEDKLKAIELPDDLQPAVAYGVAVVKGAKHPEEARKFIAGLLDGAGAQALKTQASSRRRAVRRPGWFGALLVAALTAALLFLTLPIVAIFVDTGPLDLISSLGEEGALEALRLSLFCSTVAVAVIVWSARPPPTSSPPGASAATRRSSRWSSCRSCCRRRSRGSGCSRRSGRTACSAG